MIMITNLADYATSFTSNVFLCEGNGETVLIDCGSDTKIVDHAPAKIDKIIITHKHWDHIENLSQLKKRGDPTVYACAKKQLDADIELKDGDSVDICGVSFEVILTQGHVDDAICLYSKDKKILFSGDTVFPGGSFGRTDLKEGDGMKMIESLKRITELDIQELYAGHEDPVKENVNQQIKNSYENARSFL